jgi:hypothetical protein
MRSMRSFVAKERAIALVITLLMLSVITFLAIAFIAMTKRDRSAVTATLDVDTARSMSDAALARAQTEIIAQMMAQGDVLSYDYMASHNYITPLALLPTAPFTPGTVNTNYVNYDWLMASGGSSNNPQSWAQNIGNLFYDPRPPVFVLTNGNLANPQYDFRFWVDINRNGRFETNGYQSALYPNGQPVPGVTNFNNGEPEWIGVLKYPEYVHSPTNPFIGRYAFMALPIGKTLDLNYIHNYAKYDLGGTLMQSMSEDGFIRDEGVGSWELNLAALLYNNSQAMYQTNINAYYALYNYALPTRPGANAIPNTGEAFYDASQFLSFRYGSNADFPQTLFNVFGNADLPAIGMNAIDEYGIYPSTNYPFDWAGIPQPPLATIAPWPGTYNSNMFYDVQDLFNTNKTGPYFASNLLSAVSLLDTTNRYTFQRLLDCIGTSSAPEYGVYVYSNLSAVSPVPSPGALPPPSWLRTKVNINYNNTAQIQAGPYSQTPAGPYGPYTPMPTNLVPWTNALGFFTNAADLLLRSQVFVYTNYVINVPGYPPNEYVPSSTYPYLLATFGITNIPVYNATNPGVCYNEQVHRMLQVAANIYAAANPVSLPGANGTPPVPQPPVFRPQFWVIPAPSLTSNMFVYITNFVLVTNFPASLNAYTQLSKGFYDLSNYNAYLAATSVGPQADLNFWGIPWVIGAVTNIPQFDQYSYQNLVSHERQLLFVRDPGSNPGPYSTGRPHFTNQFYEWAISSVFAMDAWNPYSNTFAGSHSDGTTVVASNYVTITLNNNYNWSTNIYVTNVMNYTSGLVTNVITSWHPHQFWSFLSNNFVTLPAGYFSEFSHPPQFVLFTNGVAAFLAVDTNQMIYPTHYWSVTTTNHVFYALFDGNPANENANLLDFVNLGPFGSSFPVTQYLITNDQFSFRPYFPMWTVSNATDAGSAVLPSGASNQILYALMIPGNSETVDSLLGLPGGYPPSQQSFGLYSASASLNTPAPPYANYTDSNIWMACDPLVHYTLGDLTSPSIYAPTHTNILISYLAITNPLTLGTGANTARYTPWPGPAGYPPFKNMLFMDPLLTSADAWQFPTNLFPGIGWLGRVHRGTPWQTIYLKSDNPNGEQNPTNDWTTWWVNSLYTYPTNDWSILDLFTAVPNDNAARGLLSVNQTNDAAWAAVFGGVIVITNLNIATETGGGLPLNPTNDVYYLMDSANGINAARTNQPNGIFHKIGDILQASALTVAPPEALVEPVTDEMVERIPQQTLGLLKLGLPQFVIYSWGQSLKPKSLYSSGSGPLLNICTNYEITGEYLTRTVCHIVSDPGAAAPRIVIDNYNIMPGN